VRVILDVAEIFRSDRPDRIKRVVVSLAGEHMVAHRLGAIRRKQRLRVLYALDVVRLDDTEQFQQCREQIHAAE
jgi:hypothetical protein